MTGGQAVARTTRTATRSDVLIEALDQVRFAARCVPAVRAHLDAAGVNAEDLHEPADLGRIPCTTKAFYRTNFPLGVLAAGVRLGGRDLQITNSSGTSGDRLTTVAHRLDLAERMSATLDINPRVRALFHRPKQRIGRYAAPNCSAVECATPNTTMADRTMPDGTLVLPAAHDLLTTRAAMTDQALRELAELRPHWLYVDPNHLTFLAGRDTEAVLPRVGAEIVVSTYSLLTASCRSVIGKHLPDATIVEVQSMSETGWLGMTCPAGFMHLAEGTFLAEFLPPPEEPELGRTGLLELVLTSLRDFVSPRIRYRTGDLYRLLPSCSCGHPGRTVQWQARLGQQLVLDGVVLTPRLIDDTIGVVPGLGLYQAAVTPHVIALNLVPEGPGARVDEHDVAARLRQIVPSDVGVVTKVCGYVRAAASGKFSTWCRSSPMKELR